MSQNIVKCSEANPTLRSSNLLLSHFSDHSDQLPSICPHGLPPITPLSDLFSRIPLCYVPHTCRQPIRTVQPIVSSLRYSPYRTPELMTPISKSSTHAPRTVVTSPKSTYPCPVSYCLKLSRGYTRPLNVSVLA